MIGYNFNNNNNNNNNNDNNNNNTLFKYIYVHKHDTRYIFEKVDREVIPIKGPLTKLEKYSKILKNALKNH